ncbi:MAG: HmuY family protein [Bradymonadaceae bacterium]
MNWRVQCSVGLLSVGLVLGGCGDDDPPVQIADDVEESYDAVGPDAGPGDEDVLTIGEVGGPGEFEHRCGTVPVVEWPLHDAVSAEGLNVAEEAGYRQATIHATGGGPAEARDNPFIYFDLETGEKVEITDHQSIENDGWDLGFKRIVIRSNGADSGPGEVTMAKAVGTTFEDAVAPQGEVAWRKDDTFDPDCEPILDPINNLVTAVNYLNFGNESGSGSWYDYGSGGAAGVGPVEGEIYFVNTPRNDKTYKVEILGWAGGVFTLRWAEIE